ANLYENEQQFEEAQHIALEGINQDEYDKRLYFIAGKMAIKLGELNKGLELLQESIALDEDYKEAILFYIDTLTTQDRFEEIVTFLMYIKSVGASDPIYDWELAKVNNELEVYGEANKY